jgi:hypothetical protein
MSYGRYRVAGHADARLSRRHSPRLRQGQDYRGI